MLNLEVVVCFLEIHDTKFGPKNKHKSVVEQWLSRSPAQSGSTIMIHGDGDGKRGTELKVNINRSLDIWEDSFSSLPMDIEQAVHEFRYLINCKC